MLKYLFIIPIKIYQVTISPLLGHNKCQYSPSCSHYMLGSIEEWGVWKGLWMGLKRIGRCHPFGGHGFDPVPKNPNKT